MIQDTDTQPECLDSAGYGPNECAGPVEYRMPLSGTGRSFPRCEAHWQQRLEREEQIRQRYPEHPPADWSPLDAGESWEEDY